MTWLDWGILIIVLGFALRGFLRGMVAQVFLALGLISGITAAGWALVYLGDHWRGLQPAWLLWVLRGLVAGLVMAGLASLWQWWGDKIGEAVQRGPAGWFDRAGGALAGAGFGAAFCALLLLVALTFPRRDAPGPWVTQSRFGAPLMSAGARACVWPRAWMPGSRWLEQRFRTAEQRARGFRPSEPSDRRS